MRLSPKEKEIVQEYLSTKREEGAVAIPIAIVGSAKAGKDSVIGRVSQSHTEVTFRWRLTLCVCGKLGGHELYEGPYDPSVEDMCRIVVNYEHKVLLFEGTPTTIGGGASLAAYVERELFHFPGLRYEACFWSTMELIGRALKRREDFTRNFSRSGLLIN